MWKNQTGQAPAHVSYPYEMKFVHDFTFGIKQQTPLSPIEPPTAVNHALSKIGLPMN